MAEGIMRDLVAERGLDWEIDSAGTGGWHAGEPPDPRAICTTKAQGTDISTLRARQFKRGDFSRFDKIYALDPKNLRDILKLAKTDVEREKVELFLTAAYPEQRSGVRDPWYDDALFEPVYQELREACQRILERIVAEGPKQGSFF